MQVHDVPLMLECVNEVLHDVANLSSWVAPGFQEQRVSDSLACSLLDFLLTHVERLVTGLLPPARAPATETTESYPQSEE